MRKTTNHTDMLISLTDMHSLACGALDRIRGVSKCALRSLETESGVHDLEAIAEVFKMIILSAEFASASVACEAEDHGIQTIDEAWKRRDSAMSTIRQSRTPVEAKS